MSLTQLSRPGRLAVVVITALALGSCLHGKSDRYSRKQAQKSLLKLETPGLVVGEFHVTKVSDGDTIRVDGLDSSLRLLGLDTEETFDHYPEQRRQYEADGWPAYTKEMRGGKPHPQKFATPLGDDAWHWAEKFFDTSEKVRIERDHPAEIRDAYNRYLAYVFVKKNGAWVNYNVECVRAGMSPYFPKYGESRRFHEDFVKAQDEARAAKRGIWAPNVMSYPDYDERLAWWNARGAFVTAFRKEGEGKDNYIDISHWDATQKLEELVGKEVHILGVVGDVRIGEKGPTRVELARSRFGGFPLVFFDRDVFVQTGIAGWSGEYVIATGIPTIYENRYNHRKQVQLQIDRAAQITLSPIPGLQIPTSTPAP
ncbi:MAG TPA: thermonuclease family protein [Kofleriaceae bacterium]|jgi:endonuclease YncB( thermonuclease family)|nr:thermonuclease family protein [Kofleriaceae bacterium]